MHFSVQFPRLAVITHQSKFKRIGSKVSIEIHVFALESECAAFTNKLDKEISGRT